MSEVIRDEITIKQGDTPDDYLVGLEDVALLTGFTCELNVTDSDYTEVVAKRTVPVGNIVTVDGEEKYAVSLTATDTGSLTANTVYWWTISLFNATYTPNPISKEILVKVNVIRQRLV
jgi:hypothetical protein